MTFDITSAAAGMGMLATVCAAVWFVMTLMTKPLRERLAELVAKDTESTKTLAKLEQRADNSDATALRHFAEDAAQLMRIENLMRDLGNKFDEGLANLRRELREDTGEFRLRDGGPRR